MVTLVIPASPEVSITRDSIPLVQAGLFHGNFSSKRVIHTGFLLSAKITVQPSEFLEQQRLGLLQGREPKAPLEARFIWIYRVIGSQDSLQSTCPSHRL